MTFMNRAPVETEKTAVRRLAAEMFLKAAAPALVTRVDEKILGHRAGTSPDPVEGDPTSCAVVL